MTRIGVGTLLVATVAASAIALGCGKRDGARADRAETSSAAGAEQAVVLSFQVDGMRTINGAL